MVGGQAAGGADVRQKLGGKAKLRAWPEARRQSDSRQNTREQGNLAQGPGAWPRECTGGDQRAGQELEGEAFEVGQGSGRGRLAEAGPHAALLAPSRGASSPGWFTGLLAHSFAGALSCWFTAPLAQARAGSNSRWLKGLLSHCTAVPQPFTASLVHCCWLAALMVQIHAGSQPR